MSSTTLTDRALEKFRRLLDGNGVSAEAVTLRESDEAVYDIPGTLIIDLAMNFTWDQPGTKRSGKIDPIPMESAAAVEAKLRKDAASLYSDAAVSAAAIAAVRAAPGEGWGANDQEFPLPELTQIYQVDETCGACRGNRLQACGACRETGGQPCPQCPGDGWQRCRECSGTMMTTRSDGSQGPCNTCRGFGRTQCLGCNGQGRVACRACGGRGRTVCQSCGGKGQTRRTGAQIYTANARFRLEENNTLPQPVQEGVRRLGALRLAEGHADIRFANSDINERGQSVLRYFAKVGFARLCFDVNGLEVRMAVLGRKAVLQRVPLVLDHLLKPALIALERARHNGDALAEAGRFRIVREALQAKIERPNADLAALISQRYPYALGKACAAAIARDITAIIALRLRRVNAIGFSVGLGLALAGFLGWFWGPGRGLVHFDPVNGLYKDLLVLALGMTLAAAAPCLTAAIAAKRIFAPLTGTAMRTGLPRPGLWSLAALLGSCVLYVAAMMIAHKMGVPWPGWAVPVLGRILPS